jgi:hypothetical protein
MSAQHKHEMVLTDAVPPLLLTTTCKHVRRPEEIHDLRHGHRNADACIEVSIRSFRGIGG